METRGYVFASNFTVRWLPWGKQEILNISSADYVAFMNSVVIFLKANVTVTLLVKLRSHISFCIFRIFILLAVLRF
jgi:hypothetical protein